MEIISLKKETVPEWVFDEMKKEKTAFSVTRGEGIRSMLLRGGDVSYVAIRCRDAELYDDLLVSAYMSSVSHKVSGVVILFSPQLPIEIMYELQKLVTPSVTLYAAPSGRLCGEELLILLQMDAGLDGVYEVDSLCDAVFRRRGRRGAKEKIC